jgi:hypothetical protein
MAEVEGIPFFLLSLDLISPAKNQTGAGAHIGVTYDLIFS